MAGKKSTCVGLDIAHTGSMHAAPGPPAVSAIMPPPPTCPTGPFPVAPFLYIAKSSAAQANSCSGGRTVISGHHILLGDSCMDIEQPGNMPSKPTDNPANVNPADQVSKVIVGLAIILDPKGTKCKVNGKDKYMAVTGATVALNIPGPKRKVHQCESALLDAMGLMMAACDHSKNPAKVVATGDPVAVANGQVVGEEVDFTLPGMIDVVWKRTYSTGRTEERTPLGRGGWTHAYHQWIEPVPGGMALKDGAGRTILFPAIEKRSSIFLRGKRLEISRVIDDYQVKSLDTRLTSEFSPLSRGGRAVLRSIRDPAGNRVELRYEGEQLATIADTARREVRLLADAEGRIVRIEISALGEVRQWVDYGYTDEGELARAVDALGNEEAYAYDALHRLAEKTLKNGLRFRYRYDPDTGRCVQSRADGGLQNVELSFDDAAHTTIVSGTPEPREYTWNNTGDIVREATFDGHWVRERIYDADQLIVEEKNAAGDTRGYEYDERGNLTTFTRADGAVITCEYQNDLVVRRTDPGGRTIKVEYDERGAIFRKTFATGAPHVYQWDRHGRLLSITAAGTLLVAYEYDEAHNIVRLTDGLGASHAYTYDAMGRILRETDPLGRVTRTEYDLLGRSTRQSLPDGTVLDLEYDALGNVVRSFDERGAGTVSEYAGTGTATRHRLPDGTTWELAYDVLERLREIKNPKAETYAFRYDRAGRLVEETTFDGQSIRYQYSRAWHLARTEFADDTWITYTYDAAGYLIVEESPHGTRTFLRNEVGWITKAVVEEHWGSVVVEREWDLDGHLLAEAIDGEVIRYAYDDLGRPSARVLPNGETTRYFYDACGALIGIDHQGEKVLLQRDLAGREVRRYAYASGVDIAMAWGTNDRLTKQYVTVPSLPGGAPRVITQRRWTFGAHARMRTAYDSGWGTVEYEHDPVGRLVDVRRGALREVLEYDVAGSLQGVQGRASAAGAPWTIRMGNALAGTDTARFEFDARRRRTKRIERATGDVTEYIWDCRDQLREVRLPGGERVLFTYDAFGRRVGKVVVGRPTEDRLVPGRRSVRYRWDRQELAMEIDSERGERAFVHEPRSFTPILQREGGESFLCLVDPVGVCKDLIDGAGRVAWAAAHSAWGRVIEVRRDRREGARAVASPFRFLGHYEDEETGLCYARHRYFDADTARWLSADPLGIHGGNNLFAFDGSPVREVDPLGLMTAGRFQSWLARTHGPRKAAQEAAAIHQDEITAGMGPKEASIHTSGSSRPTVGPARVGENDPNSGDHAETRVGDVQGQAVGAGIPHCANCTNHVMDNGGYPANSIRGPGYDKGLPPGSPDRTGWNPGQPPKGSDGGRNW